MTTQLALPTPRDLQVTWRPTRPDFVIQHLHGKGASANCYRESLYEVVSSRQLEAVDFEYLDACGLLGVGQAYAVLKTETFEDLAPAVTVDRRTGEAVDVSPTNAYSGEPITRTYPYLYWRYTVRRICDSGD